MTRSLLGYCSAKPFTASQVEKGGIELNEQLCASVSLLETEWRRPFEDVLGGKRDFVSLCNDKGHSDFHLVNREHNRRTAVHSLVTFSNREIKNVSLFFRCSAVIRKDLLKGHLF